MKVVAHEDPARPEVMSRDRRCPRQCRSFVGRVLRGRLDRSDDLKHGFEVLFRQEYRHGREEMRASGDERGRKLRIGGFGRDRRQQAGAVQGDAEARPIEQPVAGVGSDLLFGHAGPPLRAPALRPRAASAMPIDQATVREEPEASGSPTQARNLRRSSTPRTAVPRDQAGRVHTRP